MAYKHLIICCNRDMRVIDWTPFENDDIFLVNSFVVKKGDLISVLFDRLSMRFLVLSNSSHKQYIYFRPKETVE